jgi:hypothetical protein
MNRSMSASRMRTRPAMVWVCVALLLPLPEPADARTFVEVKSLGANFMCACSDALPYANDKPETPGYQIEIGCTIAKGTA